MKAPQKNWLEWNVFALGFTLVAATLGVLAYEVIATPDTPPLVTVKIGAVRHQKGRFAVAVTATNSGGKTAEGVRIEVTLRPRGGAQTDEESGDFQIDYLSHNAQSTGWVTFANDPKKGTLEARVAGYRQP